MKKYRARNCVTQTIEVVEIVKESEKCVWIPYFGRPSRVAKISGTFEAYCDTFQEAKNWLRVVAVHYLMKAEEKQKNLPKEIEKIKSRVAKEVQEAKEQLNNVGNLTDPEAKTNGNL